MIFISCMTVRVVTVASLWYWYGYSAAGLWHGTGTVTTVVEDIGWGMGRRSLDVGGYGYKFYYPCI